MRYIWLLALPLLAQQDFSVVRLRTEYLPSPLAVESAQPRLSWQMKSATAGQKQTAYRVLVASSAALLAKNSGDLWDSGRVASSQTLNVEYSGRPLASRQRCFWKVQVFDKSGRPRWSGPAGWSMGLLQPGDWKAKWISFRDRSPLHTSRQSLYLPPAREYRKAFDASKPVRRAMLYGSALGVFDASLNGALVSDAMFSPGWSDYGKRAWYRAWDVTKLVGSGANTLGATVADGWYAGYLGYALLVGYGPNKAGRYLYGKTPALLVQLEIEYTDGSRSVVATDTTWQTATGPVREADMLMGEVYDARIAARDWQPVVAAEENGSTKAVFSDTAGQRNVELGFVRPLKLQAYTGPDIRPIEEIRPTRMMEPSPGTYVFDLGQNISGVVRLRVKGPTGTTVNIRHAEMVYPGGRLMTENLRKARATDTYILRGDAAGETWTPRFTYHGFQYVELTGYPGKPTLDAVTGVVVHSDTPLASSFEASDPMLSKLHRNIVWTQRGNFVEVPTDCPQRDERLGWTGDAQIYAPAAALNADTAAFYTKWLDDLTEAQRANGAFPDYAPYPMQHGGGGYSYGTAWMDAGVIVPHAVWRAYGDTRVLERHWPAMTRFMEFRKSQSPDFRGSAKSNPWGDWLAIGSTTPIEYIDAVYLAYSARLMRDMAAALGKQAEAASYAALFDNVKRTFARDYVLPDGKLKVATQTAYALALANGLIDARAADELARLVHANGDRMATGFLGTYPLLPVLSANGHHDLAMKLLLSREFPSWGYEVDNGATTIWERWNSYTKDKGFFEPSMNSYSHYAFGAVSEWMFRGVAGIDSAEPGFGRLRIAPGPAPGLDWVKAHFDSPHGRVAVSWKGRGAEFTMEVTIPANTSASVGVPLASGQRRWVDVEAGTHRFSARQ